MYHPTTTHTNHSHHHIIISSRRGRAWKFLTWYWNHQMSNAQPIADRRPQRKPHTRTVIVVDEAGSMRKTDDEVGVPVAMWKQVPFWWTENLKPHDWLLFNTVSDILRNQEPFFEGNYLPALERQRKHCFFTIHMVGATL